MTFTNCANLMKPRKYYSPIIIICLACVGRMHAFTKLFSEKFLFMYVIREVLVTKVYGTSDNALTNQNSRLPLRCMFYITKFK